MEIRVLCYFLTVVREESITKASEVLHITPPHTGGYCSGDYSVAAAADFTHSEEECAYLEEPYVPHALVGVMAQNTASAAKEKHVWSTGDQKI